MGGGASLVVSDPFEALAKKPEIDISLDNIGT